MRSRISYAGWSTGKDYEVCYSGDDSLSLEISPDSTFPPFPVKYPGPTAGPEQEERGGESWEKRGIL